MRKSKMTVSPSKFISPILCLCAGLWLSTITAEGAVETWYHTGPGVITYEDGSYKEVSESHYRKDRIVGLSLCALVAVLLLWGSGACLCDCLRGERRT